MFAVPGSPLDPRAEGTNGLLKQGATLVTEAADVIAVLRADPRPQRRTAGARSRSRARRPAPSPATTSAPASSACSGPRRSRSTIWCGCRKCSPAIVRTVLLELEIAGRLERHGGALGLAGVRPASNCRRHACDPLALAAGFRPRLSSRRPRRRSEPIASPPSSQELWPDAQAKGVTRATFDLARSRRHARPARDRDHQTAAGIRQAVRRLRQSDRLGATASPTASARCAVAATLFDAVEKQLRGRSLGADRDLGHRNRLRRARRTSGTCSARSRRWSMPLPRSVLPQRAAGRAARSCRTTTSRARRWSVPGPAPWARPSSCRRTSSTTPSTSPATAAATSGPTCPTCWPRPPTICTNRNGGPACRGASKSSCRRASTSCRSRARFRGMEQARPAPRRRQAVSARAATASCFFRPAPRARPSSSPKTSTVLKEYNNSDAYALAIGHLADRINGGAPIQGPVAGRRPPTFARRPHRVAEKTGRARLQGQRLRGPHRFRPARQHPRRAEEARHGAGRQSDGGAARTLGVKLREPGAGDQDWPFGPCGA